MGNPIRVEVITSKGIVYSGDASIVIIPGTAGLLGVLHGHAPLVTTMRTGSLRIAGPDGEQMIAVGGGFADVRPDKVVIIARTAETAEEIDVERALAAKARALKRLRLAEEGRSPVVDVARAEAALKRAMTRLAVAGHPEGLEGEGWRRSRRRRGTRRRRR